MLRLITRLNIGGPARQALLLTRELPDFPTVLAAGVPPAGEGELSDPDVPVRRVPLVRSINPPLDAKAVVAVRRLLVHHRAGLVHTHMAKAGFVGRTAATTVRPRPRTVHTFHGHVLEGYFRAPSQRAFLEIERRLAACTDVLVAVSTYVRDALLDLGVGRPSQYEVIPLGFDLSPFLSIERPSGHLRRELGVTPETPLVGILGRLAPIKDHETMLRALALVPGAHLAVLGDGELRSRLERAAAGMGVSGRVHFVGWRIDVAACIGDLDVVALTSRNEGTPVSLIEAAATGRPAVATRVGGVADVVQHGVTGYLVERGDAAAVAGYLRRLLDDPAQRRQMGEAGRAHVRDRYSHVRLLRDIAELYRALPGNVSRRDGPG
ncbi:MAG: glycosyltransferase [Acidimicrobiia bacterium]